MKQLILLSVFATLLAGPAVSAERKATFHVPGMTCALCPVAIETAMGMVKGVRAIKVEFETRQAIAIFDDAEASPELLADASANAGYPAQLVSLE